MDTTTTRQSALDQTLLQVSALMRQLAKQFEGAVQRFNTRWEARARTAVAIRELKSLSDRDLRDMGLSRGDIPRLAMEERSGRHI